MNWLEIGLIVSLVIVVHNLQQIKMTLKDKGHYVTLFTGWFSDYNKFKTIIDEEMDVHKKTEYQGILNTLHIAMAGSLILLIFLFSGT